MLTSSTTLIGLNSYKRDYLPLFRDTLHYKYTAQWRLRRCAYNGAGYEIT